MNSTYFSKRFKVFRPFAAGEKKNSFPGGCQGSPINPRRFLYGWSGMAKYHKLSQQQKRMLGFLILYGPTGWSLKVTNSFIGVFSD